LEYFISTHGARKGLADTALKTADAGYLTRRLVDVAQDMIVTEDDCGSLRGLMVQPLRDNDDIVEPLSERVVGRVSVHDIFHPVSDELIVESGVMISDEVAQLIDESGIDEVEIRSVLTCETRRGVCGKCYGRNLTSSGHMVQTGESVGVIAAQSIGEPGTQLTLRTFHVGGTASNMAVEASVIAKFDGVVEFDEELRLIETTNKDGEPVTVVMGRSGEIKINDAKTGKTIVSNHAPYGAIVNVKDGEKVTKGQTLCKWDPYNAVILSEFDGKIEFEAIVEGVTFKEVSDDQTGFREKVIIDTKDRTKNPAIIVNYGEESKGYNIPVGAHLAIEAGDKVRSGQILVKIPRSVGKTRDITGGLPRVTELFEARNPSNPAVVSEIDGVVTYGGIKRGNREIIIESKDGVIKKYMVSLSKHILVQENDFIRAGEPLSDGAITPNDILAIKGPTAVQEYLVNEIQEVYRLQGVKINDKHIEVIVSQMMQKVEILDAGDTGFLQNQVVDKWAFREENDNILDRKVVMDAGDSSTLKPGMIISARRLRDENSSLKRKDLKLVQVRDAETAVSKPTLQGITAASLGTESFISAASFQETTKVLSEAAIRGKRDELKGLKENVIVGHLIPAGTGQRRLQPMIVGSQEEYDKLSENMERTSSKRSSEAIL